MTWYLDRRYIYKRLTNFYQLTTIYLVTCNLVSQRTGYPPSLRELAHQRTTIHLATRSELGRHRPCLSTNGHLHGCLKLWFAHKVSGPPCSRPCCCQDPHSSRTTINGHAFVHSRIDGPPHFYTRRAPPISLLASLTDRFPIYHDTL